MMAPGRGSGMLGLVLRCGLIRRGDGVGRGVVDHLDLRLGLPFALGRPCIDDHTNTAY